MRKEDCSNQEQWVLDFLAEGKIADLKQKFGEEEGKCYLRAIFLEGLLTDEIQDFKPKRQGIRIVHAKISEALDLENAEVVHNVDLDSCIFEDKVTFLDARFQRHLSLINSEFCHEAIFHRLTVSGNLFLRSTIFKGTVNFGWTDIGGNLAADAAQFGEEQKGLKVDFNGLKVGSHAIFQGAQFHGPADFMVSRIEGSLHLAPFENGKTIIHTRFFYAALFRGAQIGGELRAQQTEFLCKDQDVDFNNIVVGGNVSFRGARFHGQVNFGGADIHGQLNGQQAEFLSETHKSNFNSLRVGKYFLFTRCPISWSRGFYHY